MPNQTQKDAPGKYVVIAAGAGYKVDGDPMHVALGLQGRVIELVDAEAGRLLMQGAIRAADEDDIEREKVRAEQAAIVAAEQAAGPVGNPYGGSIVGGKSLEEHAAEQLALAKGKKK